MTEQTENKTKTSVQERFAAWMEEKRKEGMIDIKLALAADNNDSAALEIYEEIMSSDKLAATGYTEPHLEASCA